MDLKALMQKLESINNAEILTESEKKETTWTDKSGKKHPATQVKGDKYTGKEAEKEAKPKKDDLDEQFNSAIARALVEEFGYELDEKVTLPADGSAPATQQYTTPSGATFTGNAPAGGAAASPANPYAGTPEEQKFASFTPAQQEWLTRGGQKPDISGDEKTNPILSRMKSANPDPKAPAAGQAASPAKPAASTGTQVQTDDEGNHMITTPDGKTVVVGPDGKPLDNGGRLPTNKPQVPAGAPGAQDDATGVDAAVAANAADDVKRAAAGGQAASPAAPKKPAAPAVSPAIVGYASSMGLYKNGKPDPEAIKAFQKANGLAADGIIGPNTSGAILSAQKPGNAGSGRGSQGGPTAAQAAQAGTAKPAGGQAPSPAAPTAGKPGRYKTPQEYDAEIARFSKSSDPNLPPNKRYIDTLKAEKAALGGGQAPSPAAPTAPAAQQTGSGGRQTYKVNGQTVDKATYDKQMAGMKAMGGAQGLANTMAADMEESVVRQDDAILAMIRGVRF